MQQHKGLAAGRSRALLPVNSHTPAASQTAPAHPLFTRHAAPPCITHYPNRQTFALSAVECAAVLEGVDSRQLCEFFHDPNKGQPGEGSITKSLKCAAGWAGGHVVWGGGLGA